MTLILTLYLLYYAQHLLQVVDVVSRLADEGCEVTGGYVDIRFTQTNSIYSHFIFIHSLTVSNFIYKVNECQEGLTLLTNLACKGECYTNIQSAVEYCNDNPTVGDCFEYVACDCMVDLLDVIETLHQSNHNNNNGDDEDGDHLLKLDTAIVDNIQQTGTSCRCEELNSKAVRLENSESCALANQIIEEGDILAGDDTVVSDTCSNNEAQSCAEQVSSVVNGFIEYGCAVTNANSKFIYTLSDANDTFDAITTLACNSSNEDECYSLLKKTCQSDVTACLESLSCACLRGFLSIINSMSPDSYEDLIKLETTTLDMLQVSSGKCECERLNEEAAALSTQDKCVLHGNIISEESIFVTSNVAIQSTCIEPLGCVSSITNIVSNMDNHDGCSIKQKTDAMARFVYKVNDSRDLDRLALFICNNGDCYNDLKDNCAANNFDEDSCIESTEMECLAFFISLVDSLSDDGKEDFLGVESLRLDKIRSKVQSNNGNPSNTDMSNGTSSNETQVNSGYQSRSSSLSTSLVALVMVMIHHHR